MNDINSLAKYCPHSTRVYNRYTRDTVMVPCGTCEACMLNKKNKRLSSLLSYSASRPNCFFVTLTYADECIPFLSCSIVDSDSCRIPFSRCPNDGETVLLFNYEQLLKKRYDFFFRVKHSPSNLIERRISSYITDGLFYNYEYAIENYSMTDDSLHSFFLTVDSEYYNLRKLLGYVSSRCSLRNSIPFSYIPDAQNFLKRFRNRLKKLDNDLNFSYYLVSEYGPKSLRPHFHILFFFDKPTSSAFLSEIVSSCWLFGGCDSQFARTSDSVASYVASYLNSSCTLPELYMDCKKIRPRCLHSCGISSAYLFPCSSTIEEAGQVLSESLDGISMRFDSGVVSVRPPSSYINRVFPRFYGIVRNDTSQLYDLYTAVANTFRRYLKENDLSFSSLVVSSFTRWFLRKIPSCKSMSFDFLRNCFRLEHISFLDVGSNGEMIYSRIYRYFSIFFKFFKFWNVKSSFDLKRLSFIVMKFHGARALSLLRSQYEMLSSLSLKGVESYYSLCGCSDCSNHFESSCSAYNHSRVRDSVKHKELNDYMLSVVG